MAVTLAQFRERFPAFASTEDDVVELALEEAAILHNIRDLCTLYCAAHLLKLAEQQTAGTESRGEIAFERVGSMMVQYRTMSGGEKRDSPGGMDAFFASTEYGRHFLVLERRLPRRTIGARVV